MAMAMAITCVCNHHNNSCFNSNNNKLASILPTFMSSASAARPLHRPFHLPSPRIVPLPPRSCSPSVDSFQTFSLRPAALDDLETLPPILYRAFTEFNLSVGIPPYIDFGTVEDAKSFVGHCLRANSSYGVVAADCASGQPIGGAFLHYTVQEVHTVGPVFVDPDGSNRGVAKSIMQALIERSKELNEAASIRLCQVAANTKSYCLYAKLGFQPVECVSYFEGTVPSHPTAAICSDLGMEMISGLQVRRMEESDTQSCTELFIKATGYSRISELRDQLVSRPGTAWVAEKNGTLLAYTTGFNLEGYSVSTSEEALVALFNHVSQCWVEKQAPTIYIPGRLYPRLIQWALASKMRLIRHIWVMVYGQYQHPPEDLVYCPGILT